MTNNISRIQTHKLYVMLDGGKEYMIPCRSTIGGNWGVTGTISVTAVAFSKEDAAVFLVNLRGKSVRLERSVDVKTGTITQYKFEETPMLTGTCYVLKLVVRLEEESGIPQKQTNFEMAFRG